MNTRVERTWKSFWKMLLYTALFVAVTEIQKAGSWDLCNWRLISTAVGVAVIKAGLTWLSTPEEG